MLLYIKSLRLNKKKLENDQEMAGKGWKGYSLKRKKQVQRLFNRRNDNF